MRTLVLALSASVVAFAGAAQVGAADAASSHRRAAGVARPMAFALLGDTPYSTGQRQEFPELVRAVNAAAVSMVLHAGDVKSGDSRCGTALLRDRRQLFNTFADPFVLTPGDNEWTDCHSRDAGRYLPTERLATVRKVLFHRPGVTMGKAQVTVRTQAKSRGHTRFRENVAFRRADVVFATAHVVGSDNDREPWSGLPGGDRRAARRAEYRARDAADRAWIDSAFDRARASRARGVVLLMQAEPKPNRAFSAVRTMVVSRATRFGRPVLLIHGNEHRFEVQRRYAGVPNLTRLETFGVTATRWLRVRVDPSSAAVFTWRPRTVR